MKVLYTERLELVPITLDVIEAVFRGDRVALEAHVGAKVPEKWPGPALVERAFSADLASIRANPAKRLWGDRLMISRPSEGGERRVVGSVVFHGAPDDDGLVEVGYGVEQGSQGRGYGTEATCAAVEWALAQPGVRAVGAATFAWHTASVKILRSAGLAPSGWRDHELLGEMQLFERRAHAPVVNAAEPAVLRRARA
jgi:RimJ/RimL family protein N-acetyltransferase